VPRTRLLLAAVPAGTLLVCLWLYGRALVGYFIYDDFVWLDCASDTLLDWRHIFNLHISNFFRPVCHLVFAALSAVWGPNPVAHHVAAFLLHVACATLLGLLAARLADWRTGVLCTTLFVLIPLHAEAVTWIAAITEPIAALSMLACLLAWHRFVESRRASSYLLALVAFLLALGAKESAVMLLPLMVLVDWAQRPPRRRWFPRLWPYAAPTLLLAIYLILQSRWQRTSYLIVHGHYALGSHVLPTVGQSLWRLLDQTWLPPLAAAIGALVRRVPVARLLSALRTVAPALVAVPLVVLPHAFFRHSTLSGRYFYLAAASMALVGALALRTLLGDRTGRVIVVLALGWMAAQAATLAPVAVDRYLVVASEQRQFVQAARRIPTPEVSTTILSSPLVGEHLFAALRVFHPGRTSHLFATSRPRQPAPGLVWRWDAAAHTLYPVPP
jgi:hypothetical protein